MEMWQHVVKWRVRCLLCRLQSAQQTAHNFNTLNKDPTNKFQKSIHKIVKECSSVIDKRQRQFIKQKKPSAPVLKAQLKLHKIGIPIVQ